jgi:hypothetical protein
MTGRTARRDRDGGQARISGLRPDRILRGHRRRRVGGARRVLETTFGTRDGTVRVIDSLNQDANGPLPWAELSHLALLNAAALLNQQG